MNRIEPEENVRTEDTRYAFCVVNGKLQTEPPASVTMLEWLREEIECKDVPRPCETGHCGACVVIVDGESIKSCSTLALEIEGRQVFTVSDLELTGRKPVAALRRAVKMVQPFQCAYCQPAFVVAALELLEQNCAPSDSEIRQCFSGFLCRCTGYQAIVDAVLLAAKYLTAERKTSG